MSSDTPKPAPSWPTLDPEERRVVGVLIEKAKTTPDSYPLTLNALVAGCNQKSNRDPVMQLTDLDVEDALARLQKKGVVIRMVSSRVDRWRHQLYEEWHLDRVDLALLCELLLRGPQTEGELRSRVLRMESFGDLEAMREAIQPLVGRNLVVYLTPQGKRGTALTHGFHTPAELEQIRKRYAGSADDAPAPPPVPSQPDLQPRLQQAQDEIARLAEELKQTRATVAELRQMIDALSVQMKEVRQGLGM
jgi:uncharacterized protein YceH (UPF0502 family)